MEPVQFNVLQIIIVLMLSLRPGSTNFFGYSYEKLPVDHFDDENNDTFKISYMKQDLFWESGGPLYFYIGGEYPIDTLESILTNSFVFDLANETNGMIYLLEHRYFGRSDIPGYLEETRYKYLNVKQVLADIAYVIKKQRRSFTTSKVVIIGGSYAGRLATWMRLKYPELVDAAVASSAPLKNSLEFPEYYDQVADVYQEFGGYKCLKAIQNKIQHESLLLRSEIGEDILKKEEKFCPDVKIHDIAQKKMYGVLVLNQISSPVLDFNYGQILSRCDNILSQDRLDGSSGCYFFDFNITGWSEDAFDYLRCAEIAQFPISTHSNRLPFDVPLDMYIDRCIEVYGEHFNADNLKRSMIRLDEEYGGVTPNVTKVVFINGGLDLWHHLGVLKDLSADAPAIFMKNTTHCEDLSSEQSTDSQELKDTRMRVKELVKDWIEHSRQVPARDWSFFKPPSWDQMEIP